MKFWESYLKFCSRVVHLLLVTASRKLFHFTVSVLFLLLLSGYLIPQGENDTLVKTHKHNITDVDYLMMVNVL